VDRLRVKKTDSTSAAASPAIPARTAEDAYKSFGVAFRRLLDELVELNVEPTHVNQNLAAVAAIPPMLVPPIARLAAQRQMQAAVRRSQPDPEIDLERLAGGGSARDYARRRIDEIKNDL
jgi:DNA-binding transcriptional regulator YdaS (Cro superfamily)